MAREEANTVSSEEICIFGITEWLAIEALVKIAVHSALFLFVVILLDILYNTKRAVVQPCNQQSASSPFTSTLIYNSPDTCEIFYFFRTANRLRIGLANFIVHTRHVTAKVSNLTVSKPSLANHDQTLGCIVAKSSEAVFK